MAHITFIHGICNKPAKDQLLTQWQHALSSGDGGVDLGAEGITSTMVYWADILYEKPEDEDAGYESVDELPKVDEHVVLDPSWRSLLRGSEDHWIRTLAWRLGVQESGKTDEEVLRPASIGVGYERIPLPKWLKKDLMETFLRDVHHYLFNSSSSPRKGETYCVQEEIRRRMLKALGEGAKATPPHVVVSHSMGTVIAYDCLKRVRECCKVDALMTIGSPLGLDEIQDELRPEWTRADGYPTTNVPGRWVNVYDRFDPVAGFDPDLNNDFLKGGVKTVEDLNEQNSGLWRHNIVKYLSGQNLRAKLRELLGI